MNIEYFFTGNDYRCLAVAETWEESTVSVGIKEVMAPICFKCALDLAYVVCTEALEENLPDLSSIRERKYVELVTRL